MKNVFRMVNISTLLTVGATVVLIGAYLLFPSDGLLAAAITAGTICYHSNARGLIGVVSSRQCRDRLDPHSFWFRQHRFEPGLYRLLKVKRWKDKMPTYDPQAFSLKDRDLNDIILNSCNAELVHEVCMAAGFLPLAMVPFVGAFWVFFITSTLSAMADGVFVLIQRYNRPRLLRLAEKRKGGRHGTL